MSAVVVFRHGTCPLAASNQLSAVLATFGVHLAFFLLWKVPVGASPSKLCVRSFSFLRIKDLSKK